MADVYRKNSFCSTDEFSTNARFSQVCTAIPRQLQGAKVFMPGSIPVYGICSADLSRESARYRSLSACCTPKALPHGYSRKSCSKHSGRRQRKKRLAYLRGFRSSPYPYSHPNLLKILSFNVLWCDSDRFFADIYG